MNIPMEAGLVFAVICSLVGLAVKVGAWATKINRNERDIGVIFKKIEDILSYVKNGRPGK